MHDAPGPRADRRGARTGRGGRAGGGQRARGRPPRRRLAGGAVPAFSQPRRPDGGGGPPRRSGVSGPRSTPHWPKRLRVTRWRGFGPLGSLICAGQCVNPAHFEIISSGRYFDHDRAAGLSRDNAELIGLAEATLAEAFARGQLNSPDLKRVQVAGRALVYGFARMNIDGHFPRWGIAEGEAAATAEAILDLLRASPGVAGRPELAAQTASRLGIHPASRRLRQIHCAFMTFHLHFHDTSQVPAAPSVSWSSPAKAQGQCRCNCVPNPWRLRQIKVHLPPSPPPALPRSESGGCWR